VAWEESNLWLVDERMAYQQFVASDKALRSHGTVATESLGRPDVASYYDAAFDLTFAFAEGTYQFSSVCLIEFKKPERTSYDETENPVTQVIRYIREIRDQKAITKDRHTFRIAPSTPIFVHVICHIVDELRPFLKPYPCIESPDGQGVILHMPGFNALIEIITFEKLIADARKRNDIFFEKLGVEILPG